MANGLSPLARGTRHFRFSDHAANRFIPAGAGNTQNHTKAALTLAVYPRWRGEHCGVLIPWHKFSGLSPLARGTLSPHHQSAAPTRFIPAGAGNTTTANDTKREEPVYPRWRGEHERDHQILVEHVGLSPLARGTPRLTQCEPRHGSVYPRWRGEHWS